MLVKPYRHIHCIPDVIRTESSKSQMLPWLRGNSDRVTDENTATDHNASAFTDIQFSI